MVEDGFLRFYVKLLLLHDPLVIVYALLQHMIVRGQMGIHQTDGTTVNVHSYANGTFVSPYSTKPGPGVLRLDLS
uniref:Putative secreted protein n=1 Tax=Anopheles darlingi TaxID=43151 RepID=A0A2M4DLZ6_ANODA